MPDQTLICVECKNDFVFTEREQKHFATLKGDDGRPFSPPKRCKECRRRKKEKMKEEETRRRHLQERPWIKDLNKIKIAPAPATGQKDAPGANHTDLPAYEDRDQT